MVVAFNLNDARFFRFELHRVHGPALESKLLVDALAFKADLVGRSLNANEMQPDRLACLNHDLRGFEGEGEDGPLALGIWLAQDKAAPMGRVAEGNGSGL